MQYYKIKKLQYSTWCGRQNHLTVYFTEFQHILVIIVGFKNAEKYFN